MCLGRGEPGGPRRCAAEARTAYQISTATVDDLQQHHCEVQLAQAAATYDSAVSPFHMPLTDQVQQALRIARQAGGNPLIAGGAVRDAALGAAPHDVDIEVHHAGIDDLASSFRAAGYTVDEVGKAFGVLKIAHPGQPSSLDITVPRRDNKTGAGHRGFSVDADQTLTVRQATARRDFTINALLHDPYAGLLIDPYGGLADLRSRTLRAVSPQFSEDPLRVLRGVQLAGRLGLRLHPQTAQLCQELRPHFRELPAERVQQEWEKLFTKGSDMSAAVQALRDSGWDDTLPGLRGALAQPGTPTALQYLPALPAQHRTAIGAAIIASAIPSAADRDQFLHYSVIGKETQIIAADLAAIAPAELDSPYARKFHAHRMAARGFTFDRYAMFSQAICDPAGIRAANAAQAEGVGNRPEPPLIQGRDVIAARTRKPGPWVGELVTKALERQYRGGFANRAAALEWLQHATR